MIQTREALIANGMGLAQLRVEIGFISEIIFKYSNKGSERKKITANAVGVAVVYAVGRDSFLSIKSNLTISKLLFPLLSN